MPLPSFRCPRFSSPHSASNEALAAYRQRDKNLIILYVGDNLTEVGQLKTRGEDENDSIYLTTTYEYGNGSFPHLITKITRTYDDDNELTVTDALGNTTGNYMISTGNLSPDQG